MYYTFRCYYCTTVYITCDAGVCVCVYISPVVQVCVCLTCGQGRRQKLYFGRASVKANTPNKGKVTKKIASIFLSVDGKLYLILIKQLS